MHFFYFLDRHSKNYILWSESIILMKLEMFGSNGALRVICYWQTNDTCHQQTNKQSERPNSRIAQHPDSPVCLFLPCVYLHSTFPFQLFSSFGTHIYILPCVKHATKKKFSERKILLQYSIPPPPLPHPIPLGGINFYYQEQPFGSIWILSAFSLERSASIYFNGKKPLAQHKNKLRVV